MKKIPAIRIKLNGHSCICKDMDEYNKLKKYYSKAKQNIVSEEIVLVNDAETLEELGCENPDMWWNDLSDIDKKYHIGLLLQTSDFSYPCDVTSEDVFQMHKLFFNL